MPRLKEKLEEFWHRLAEKHGFDGPAGHVSGNRCGHDPAKLDAFRPPGKLKKFLVDAITKIDGFYTRHDLYPEFSYHEKGRRRRSERRQACVLVLQVLIAHCDLVTLRSGKPPNLDKTMAGMTMLEIAFEAGLNLRRAERAMKVLKKLKIVGVHKRAEKDKETGLYVGRAAIRTIDKLFFGILNMSKRLKTARQEATDRLKQMIRESQILDKDSPELARARLNLRRAAGLTSGSDPPNDDESVPESA